MDSRKFSIALKNVGTCIFFFVSLFAAGCTTLTTQDCKTMTVSEGCEQVCKVINATRVHALALDPTFFTKKILYSVTNNEGIWEVVYHTQPPPNMVILGGGVIYLVDSKTLAIIDLQFTQ